MKRIKAAERRQISKEMHPLTSMYHDAIPLDKFSEILKKHGMILLQEDNTEWSGLLCGREANTVFTLGDIESRREEHGIAVYEPILNGLYFYWYKMESGRYEINAYLT